MRLTPAQESQIPAFAQKYLAAARSPRRITRERIETLIAGIYAETKRQQPEVVVLASPAEAQDAIKSFRPGISLWKQMFHNIQDQLWKTIDGELARHIRQHTMPVETAIHKILHPAYEQLMDDHVLPLPVLFGTSGLCWMMWAKYAGHIGVVYGDDQSRRLNLLEGISFECEFWWPFEKVCFVSERPVELHCVGSGELHNDNGPAVKYEDGYRVYVHHGERLRGMQWLIERGML